MTYSNTKLRTLTVQGGTTSDLAIKKWEKMGWAERYEVQQKVKQFKSICLLQRACINYIADFML